MTAPEPHDVTQLLHDLETGKPGAAEALVPLVYDALRELAGRAMAREGAGHTLQPTALVHEAFLRLAGQRSTEWKNRTHFYAIAARIMRRVLVDHARSRGATKRRGGTQVILDEALTPDPHQSPERALDLIAIEDAMIQLESLEERSARVVELRFFAGLDVAETAEALGISPASVKRDWAFARAFLQRELASGGTEG